MRGKEFANIGEQAVKGITPACAGKSTGDETDEETFGDHPRVCGEKNLPNNRIVDNQGSPPRVRGKD